MTTIVKNVTSTRQVLTRDLADLDPKVRNQIPVVVIAILAAIIGATTGHLTLAAAGAIAGPPTLSFVIAYVTTSSHRKLILDDLQAGVDVLKESAPAIVAAVPEAAPIIEDAESLAAAVRAGVVTSDTTAIPAPVA